MKTIELFKYLDNAIPASLSCHWDNDGLMCCGSPEKEVKKVLISLDITEKAVNKAIAEGFDVIISHHPMIFKKIGGVEPNVASARKAIALIKNDISAMSFHTRLDALNGGVNDVLAEKLGLQNTVPFGPEGEEMGRIGYLSAPTELDELCQSIKKALGAPVVLSASCGKKAHKVAILGGDGKDFVSSAKNAGADTYISGRISYNLMVEASEMGINLVEAGHYFTEAPICEFLATLVKKADASIETEIFSSNEIKIN